MKFTFIAPLRACYPITLMCQVMKVSRGGFYDYQARIHREPSVREQENVALLEKIKAIFEKSRKRYPRRVV